jgi:hypothetical protein
MKKTFVEIALASVLTGGLVSPAFAVDPTVSGAGNAVAARLAAQSALVTSARSFIAHQVRRIGDQRPVVPSKRDPRLDRAFVGLDDEGAGAYLAFWPP